MKKYCTILYACLTVLLSGHVLDAAAQSSDLTGIWLRNEGTSESNPMSQWSPAQLPLTTEGLSVFNSNIPGKGPRQQPPALGNDPLGGANPPGLYRTLVYGRPWEFLQLPDRVVQIFEWGKHWRIIWTDGREISEDDAIAGPYWYGYSVGRWENNTLVVQTTGIDGRAWIDEWGTPVSEYDAWIEERWSRVSDTSLELTITVTDPLYSQPWTSEVQTFAYQPKGSRNGNLMEVIFAPMDEQEFNERIRDPSAAGPTPLE